MSSDTPQVREKFFMSTQGERLFTILIGAGLAGFMLFLFVGCSQKLISPPEVQALKSCLDQPALNVTLYSGTDPNAKGTYQGEKNPAAVDIAKSLVDAVSQCRTKVLDFYAGNPKASK